MAVGIVVQLIRHVLYRVSVQNLDTTKHYSQTIICKVNALSYVFVRRFWYI